MRDFLVHQKVTIWQAFTIKAEDADDAVAKVKADPSCSGLENNGIDYFTESETVLATALFDGEDSQDKVLFTHAIPGHAQDLEDSNLPMPDPDDQCERLTIAQVTRRWLGGRMWRELNHKADFRDSSDMRDFLLGYGTVEEYADDVLSSLSDPDPEERRKLEYLLAQTDVSYFQIIE